MLEALGNALAAKHKRSDIIFDSCGWSVDYSERLASGVGEELRRRKLPLDSFRSKRLEMALVENAALVLCVEEGLSARVREAYPARAARVRTLAELGGSPGDLPGLKGVGPEDYRACADAAGISLEKAWNKIEAMAS